MNDTDPPSRPGLTVTEVGERLGLSPHTVRYYERAGLVEVGRGATGHRVYDEAAIERLHFLVRMRSSGMGIGDLRRYVELVNAGESTAPQRRRILLAHREKIRARLRDLEDALAATEHKIAVYGGSPGGAPDAGTPVALAPDRPTRHTPGGTA